MPSMTSKIGSQNNKVENNSQKAKKGRECDCPKTKGGKPFKCNWDGKCLNPGMVYKCTARAEDGSEAWNYIGLTGGKIKARISNHIWECKAKNRCKTTLSKKVVDEREIGIKARTLHWEKLASAKARGPNQRLCNLCNRETLLLMKRNSLCVNDWEEIGGYCAHRRGWLLQNIKEEKVERERKKVLEKVLDIPPEYMSLNGEPVTNQHNDYLPILM